MSVPLFELRVLAGPQTGASLGLKPGVQVDVGSLSASGCQVVLRDPRVSEQRVRLHVRLADVRIEVLSGTVDMAGRQLVAPCVADWPCFMPVRIGDTVLAVGDSPDEAQWSQALNLALAPPSPPSASPAAEAAPDATSTEDQPGLAEDPAPAPAKRRPEFWLAIGGGLLTVAAVGLLAFVAVITPARVALEPAPARLARLLNAPEFKGLRGETDKENRLFIRGDLLNLADQARLSQGLAAASLQASVEVRVGEQVAMAVRDVYRMNGVVAEAELPTELAAVGQVKVRTRESDLPRLQQVEAAARRDVPGLAMLQVENTPPEVVPEPTPVVDDPGKRVASIVPGPTPYVVTVDGTRYFVGALLPSGHRLASVSDKEVMLEKDGKLSPLKF